MSRTNNPSKVKNKNDGRSSYRDILGFTWKKEGNKYVQYRGNGTKTGKTKPIVKEQPKYVSPRERKFGKDKKKDDLKVNKKKTLSNIPAEEGSNKKFNPDFGKKTKINKDKPENKKVDKKKVENKPYVDPDAADKKAEKNFRSSSSVEQAKQKSDPLRKYRRGGDTGRKETRITKKLKKAGFTSDRLAKLRQKNAAFQKAKKGGKEAMKAYRKKYPKRG